ncbi:MAG: NAD-dependent epimerase/dehydratase family protein [Acidiferrobacterales bacterium]
MKAALVTGATGFIGRALCVRRQERGVGVRALARRQAAGPWNEFVVTDLGGGVLPWVSVYPVGRYQYSFFGRWLRLVT